MIALPVAHSFIVTLAPDKMRGRFMGVLGMAWSAATMIGPAVGLLLFAHSPVLLWISCGALGLLAAASVLGCREEQSETQRVTESQTGKAA